MANDYTLGRGKLYFARFVDTVNQVPGGEKYFGNTPAMNLTIEAENLDHFSSDSGIREKDDSVALETNRTGSFTTDNISADNLALFFFGSKSTVTHAGGAVTGEAIADVEQGLFYQLGQSSSAPSGVRNVSLVTVKVGATTKTVNTDYVLDATLGRIQIVEGGGISDGDDITVDYTVAASTREQVISGDTPIEGALRYVANNPRGTNRDFYMPYVKITPNGEFNLKGEEWLTIPFNLEVLKREGYNALYIDGRAV